MYSFFSIKTQFENLGDALINRELMRLASMHSSTVVDLSRCEESFAKSIVDSSGRTEFINGFSRLLVRMVWARIKRNECYYFLSPGGYFGEISLRDLPSRLLNTITLAAMRAIGIRIQLVGISTERLSPGAAWILRARRLFIHRLVVRDGLSRDYLSKLRIRVDATLPDLAFNLYKPLAPTTVRRFAKNVVAISFRCDQHPDSKAKIRSFIERLIFELPSTTELLFYSQVVRDDAFMNMLSMDPICKRVAGATFISEHRDIEAAQRILSNAHVVYSNRLHVLLLAGSVGAPIVPIVQDDLNSKISGLFGDLSVPTVSVDSKFPTLPQGIPILEAGVGEGQKLRTGFEQIYVGKSH